jgi:hypothetical protein
LEGFPSNQAMELELHHWQNDSAQKHDVAKRTGVVGGDGRFTVEPR